jgi:short subunit dehydrogenase-like uncharacterized protein
MKNKILIYGAGGYMGKLFTQYAKSANINIVLGSRDSLESADEVRCFSLEEVTIIKQHLADIKLVVNLAGPFGQTQKSLIEACLQTHTHYIDIAGETTEFETAFAFNKRALTSNIMLMPGAGFGVVPTDIAAKLAHEKLLDATHLIIAYATIGGATRGTLKTVLKDIHKEGIEVVNGKTVRAMPAKSDFYFSVNGKNQRVVYNPWRGDLVTAQHSTKIQNIQTFANFPGIVESMMKGKMLWLRDFILKRLINFLPVGPSEKALKKGKTYIYAEVKNENGKKESIFIEGPEAYVFTAQSLTNIAIQILQDNWQPGFQTPSIYGKKLLLNNFENVIIK